MVDDLCALFRDDWTAERLRTAAPVSTTLTDVVRGLWVREAPLALDGVVEPRLLFRIRLLAARGETRREMIRSNSNGTVDT